MSPRNLDYDAYTVGWVCVLDCELNAARALLDEEDEPLEPALNDDNLYLTGRIGNHNVVVVFPNVYGTICVAQAVTNLVRTFPNIRFGLMVGVGGGAPSAPHPDNPTRDIRLGDVVVSEPKGSHGGVLNYDVGKWKNEKEFSIESHLNSPPAVLLQGIRRLRLDQRFGKGKMVQYIQESVDALRVLPDTNDPSFPGRDKDQLFKSDYDHVGGTECLECDDNQTVGRLPRASDSPVIHYGLIACGNAVIRSAKFRDRLRDAWNVLCFEMEAAGLMNRFPCIVIRGICDYSDGHKSKIWQPYAAIAAAAYAKDLLRIIGPEQVTRTEVATNILQDVFTTLDQVDENVRKIIKTVEDTYKAQVLEWLSPLDYQSQQSDFFSHREEGTGRWLLETEQFETWQEGSKKSLLCLGIPGVGKTIMTSIVIDHLHQQLRQPNVIGLAYMYCNFRRQDEQTLIGLLASLLKQLCWEKDPLPECVNEAYEMHKARNAGPSLNELLQLLHTVITSYHKVYIVIDAVDEITTSDGTCRTFLSALFGLQESTRTWIFATSRFNTDISRMFKNKGSNFLEIRALDDDVRSYVEGQFMRMQPFIFENSNLRSQIKEGIVKAVGGMFLLAKFHVDSLRDKVTRSEVRHALETLPKGSNAYDKMYADAMSRIQAQTEGHRGLAMRALAWIVCTQRPLTTLELQHALAAGANSGAFETDDIPDLGLIIAVCSGIVTVDEKSHIIRLVHFTAQEYFDRNWKRWFPHAHSEIAAVCAIYLSLGKEYFVQTHWEDRTPDLLFEYSIRYFGHHAKEVLEEGLPLLKVLEDQSRASAIGNHHTIRCLCGGPCFSSPNNATGLHLAAFFGLRTLSCSLVKGGIQCDVQDSYGMVPLAWAAARNNDGVAEVLLQCGANPNHQDQEGRTPLIWAAGLGHVALVKLLLSKGAKVSIKDGIGRTPLGWALAHGHRPVVDVLMADGMLFQEDSLHLLDSIHHLELGVIVEQAIQHGHMNTIDRLINTDRMDRRPLLLASARDGRLKIVERLLQKGVDPDYREQDWGRSPISQAAEYDHPDVVRLLLNHNVDPNMRDIIGSSDTQDNEGETALMWTGRCGCEEACRVLLEHGADPNLQAKYGQSALIWAARNGHEGTARVIIQHGADPNLRDQDGRHGLSFASEAGHESIVRLLLETTLVDIDARGTNGRTALFWAAIKGHLKIIELLLHSGADCQIKDTANRTALEWAMEEDHEAVVRMLQQHAEK